MESSTVITLVSVLTAPISGLTGAWLHAKYGRKMRLKVGEIEVEAQTYKEIKELLAMAQDFSSATSRRKSNKP
ncbi:MAG: hypothetical protein ACRD19_17160 [Terriglobia bacterium]